MVASFPSPHVGAPLLPGYISASNPVSPPAWATQMVLLLKQQTAACELFFAHYFDENDGQMEMYPRWGGNDGPDDAIENLTHWPVLYALGGGDSLVDMCHRAWEGIFDSTPTRKPRTSNSRGTVCTTESSQRCSTGCTMAKA